MWEERIIVLEAALNGFMEELQKTKSEGKQLTDMELEGLDDFGAELHASASIVRHAVEEIRQTDIIGNFIEELHNLTPKGLGRLEKALVAESARRRDMTMRQKGLNQLPWQ